MKIALRYQDYSPRERLAMLADYLEEQKLLVHMGEWYEVYMDEWGAWDEEDYDETTWESMLPYEVTGQEDINLCGTAACGAGWSAILFDVTDGGAHYWAEIVELLYGFSYNSTAGKFLFSSFWSNPEHADCEREELVARIRLYLESGVPHDWSFQDLYGGDRV